MANHKSTIKSIRKNEKRRLLNRSQHRTTRSAIKKLLLEIPKIDSISSKEIFLQYSKVASMLDKLAKKNIIHKNKASRIKARFRKKINELSSSKVSEGKETK